MTNNTNLLLDGLRESSSLKVEIFNVDSVDVLKEMGDENLLMQRMGKPEELQTELILPPSDNFSFIDGAIFIVDEVKTVL